MVLLKAIGKVPSRADRKEYEKRTKYFEKGKFRNISDKPLMVREHSVKAADRIPKEKIAVVKQMEIPAPKAGLSFYWLGHSSLLLQMAGKNILIDPVLTRHSSPFNRVGVKRYTGIPLAPAQLPRIDILLLSHDHYDHLDYQTIMAIKDKVDRFVVPLGVEAFLKSWGIRQEKITVLSWWEKTRIKGLRITATPAQHFSTRNPLHSNASWWCGFCLESNEHTVYYSGDGGYSESFREIGKKFSIDLAFLECGQYDAAWPHCHMFPEETVQAAVDLKANWSVPVHWGAFCLCNSAWNDSVVRFMKAAKDKGISAATPRIGERVAFEKLAEYRTEWYR